MPFIRFQQVGAVLAFFGVALGAFGAHALKARLDEAALSIWHTAVSYQIWHALGLLILGLMLERKPHERLLRGSGYCLIGGTLLFSGSLYLLVLTGIRHLGAITPLGGSLLLAAWLLLALALFRPTDCPSNAA